MYVGAYEQTFNGSKSVVKIGGNLKLGMSWVRWLDSGRFRTITVLVHFNNLASSKHW